MELLPKGVIPEGGAKGLKRLARLMQSAPDRVAQAEYAVRDKVAPKLLQKAIKLIQDKVTLATDYIEKKVSVTTVNDAIEITATKTSVLLSRFENYQVLNGNKRKGVKYKVYRQQPTKYLSRGFYYRLKNGNTGIALRTNRRLQILHGPSVNEVAQECLPELRSYALNVYTQELMKELRA